MTETGLFVAGALVTIVVFTGGFLYAILSFDRWANRENNKSTPPNKA